jgi:PAS domain S-box-containing protein
MDLDFHANPAILARVVDAMADGVFTVDAGGCFVAWSAGAERITGYAQAEVAGRPASFLEGPECRGFGKVVELLRDPQGQNGIRDEECRIVSKSGRTLYLLGNLRLLRDEHGTVQGAVGTFSDLSAWIAQRELAAPAMVERARSDGRELGGLVGRSPAMREVLRRIRLAAESDVSTLIRGESGTGKELAARAIHDLGARAQGPFVAINVTAVPATLLESELFGHVKGAFTGAARDQRGLFEAAAGGTLFLDEVGDLPNELQAKLLRVLQEREVRPVGAERARPVDVRLVSATHRDLRARIAQGLFREDFYFRIKVFEIEMPPLRERRIDVPLLAERFVAELSRARGKPVKGLTREALECLVEAPWPGNVRELRNALEHAFVLVQGDRIGLLDLPEDVRAARERARGEPGPALEPGAEAERARIRRVLERTRWNRTLAAQLLGISRMTLWKRMKRYGLGADAQG